MFKATLPSYDIMRSMLQLCGILPPNQNPSLIMRKKERNPDFFKIPEKCCKGKTEKLSEVRRD